FGKGAGNCQYQGADQHDQHTGCISHGLSPIHCFTVYVAAKQWPCHSSARWQALKKPGDPKLAGSPGFNGQLKH
ncbi:MAG: hypothetical protein ABIK68_07540, partial [bacterium]